VIGVLEPLQHDSTLGATPDGGLTKQGSGTLTLGEANTYTGPTTVSAGTLDVNGSLVAATTVNVGASGTLGGTGTVSGNVTCSPGGTVAPGDVGVIGTLTVGGNASLVGAEMELNVTTSPSNDVLSVGGTLTYGGTLTVSNLTGTLAVGQSFTLFKAASLGGSFSATNLPTLGAGLGWNWNPATGTLSVIAVSTGVPLIKNPSFSGGNLTISVSNVQPGTYYLLTSTNLLTPLNQWAPISTNVISASPSTITGTNVVTPGDKQQYYILSGTP
jgi:autotransporter-associated beta strand protein